VFYLSQVKNRRGSPAVEKTAGTETAELLDAIYARANAEALKV
jgi:hypothetical protein